MCCGGRSRRTKSDNQLRGSRTTPSIVGFAKDGERLVGQSAKRQAITNAENTIFLQRLIGRKYKEVKNEVKNLPYEVVSNENGDAYIKCKEGDEEKEYALNSFQVYSE